jgi:peptidoglycan LD-endopeptidase LytH
VLASAAVSGGLVIRGARFGAATALLALSAVAALSGAAAGEESLSDLEQRMQSIQADLDATTAKIEKLRDQSEAARARIQEIEERMDTLSERRDRLQREAVKRADALYKAGGTGMVEVLFGSRDLSQLTDRAEMLSHMALEDNGVFVELSRSETELEALSAELEQRREELAENTKDLQAANERLQGQFEAVSADYKRLKARLARIEAARRRAAAQAAAEAQAQAEQPAPVAATAPVVAPVGGAGKVCPVNGPVSFVDSWGAPRDGHTHQGVDMMAAYGTPVVAITSGTITYAAYDGSGGNMIFLTGDDGNDYWYMHNQENIVTGGHVSTGQQIATVGDTGNAEGTPHLHFEYHPGGGGAVNPYPLVSSVC